VETVLNEACANCGNMPLPDGRFCLFCGDLLANSARQEASSRDFEVVSSPSPLAPETNDYAGFWLRVWAGLIDVALEAVGALVLTIAVDLVLGRFGRVLGFSPWDSKFATGMSYILILSIGAWLYCAFAESSSWQATIGKRLLGLRVVTAEGGRISFGQATIRHLMKFLSLFSAGFGFMMAAWTERRQALHDMPSDCLVVRVPPSRGFSLLRH
jgi:uncharacterized RDD family membrane protein YckC